jgi:hypothetical protein
LKSYTTSGIARVGFEPAKNMMEYYFKQGHNVWNDPSVVNEFWSADEYELFSKVNLDNKKPKIITACGMFYDMEDPNQFVADVSEVLDPDGVFISQLMCAKQMLAIGDVGNLTHEHLEFYTLRSLKHLFEKHGLRIIHVEENSINGGSYRIFARKMEMFQMSSLSVLAAIRSEDNLELHTPQPYLNFFQRVESNKVKCVALIKDLVGSGKRVWAYGASTKGNVILQYFGLDHTLIEGASDRSPEKWGRFTVGSMIPICSEEDARKANPDYFLCLPFAFRQEFLKREEQWWNHGGRFIFPFPELEVV